MWQELLRAIPVFIGSMIKFIVGPTLGFAERLHILTTIVVTVAGTMTSVIAFTYFGKYLKEKVFNRFFTAPKTKGATNTRWKRIFSRYGLSGIAFLMPLILTPIGGTLLAVGFGSPKEKIIFYMLISSVAWSIIFTVTIYYFGHKALPEFVKW